LFDQCDTSVRRAVRKAERSGVSVRFATDMDSLRDYYQLHCRTRTRLGSPPQPFRFFASICEHILQQGHGFIALAMHQDRPVSGAVFFEFNGKAIYKFSASDERLQELRGANLVIWRAIEKLSASGARELNFGRTSLANNGLRRFKLNWGAGESAIARIRYCFETQSTTLVRDLANGVHARLFAALPICVSRWIGALAYPHLT
jgi:lipid II:glycine glycyltransferase (peptidoglycan interpeptide bridge formation enzyme)